jgi:hypothetical protein
MPLVSKILKEECNMKQVKCVDNYDGENYLTIGRVYDVLEETKACYTIINDEGDCSAYYKTAFEAVGKDAEIAGEQKEFSGNNVDYYIVEINEPKRLAPYYAEAEDIIEALGMTFAEGCAFKAIWRSCAARTLGKKKKGQDEEGIYDAEKVVYYGGRILATRKKAACKNEA